MTDCDLAPVYMIGHSTRSVDAFVELLGVGEVVCCAAVGTSFT